MEKNNNNNVTLGIWTLYVFIRDTKGEFGLAFFKLCFFEKVVVLKSAVWNWVFFFFK